jgi:hypothetical protein
MSPIYLHIRQCFPGSGNAETLCQNLTRACESFVRSGLADPKFVTELTSGSKTKLWSCVSEALIAERLQYASLQVRPTGGEGPDFLVMDEGRKVWVEVICPEPVGVPADWLTCEAGTSGGFPHNEILLRWTAAFKEKAEKLIGSADGMSPGYLAKGLVDVGDSYVIAINGCQLRSGPFPALFGISQFPFAAEAVFPIGPYQLQIDRDTLEIVDRGHQIRFHINKHNGALVRATAFIDPRFKEISAVWAVDLNGASVLGNQEPMAIIHNPLATNRIRIGFLPADDEYVAESNGSDEFTLTRLRGSDAHAG